MKYYKVAAFCVLISTISPPCAFSQVLPGDSLILPFLYSKNHFGVSVSGLVIQKASVSQEVDIYDVGSSPQRGVSFGLHYFSNFNQSHSLAFSLTGGVMGRNFEFLIPKEEFNPPAEIDIYNNGNVARKMDLFFIGLGIAGEKRWYYHPTTAWKAQAGIQFLYSPSTGGTNKYHIVQQNQITTFLYFDLLSANKHKPWLTYFIKGGHLWMLKNKNLIAIDVGGKLSFTDFATGSYTFTVPNKPDIAGKYSLTGSHILIELSYVFTGLKKNLRALDER